MVTQDILRDILYRLPIQDLKICKLTNKEFNNLISDPEFDCDKRRVMGDNALITAYEYERARFEVYGLRCDGNKQALTFPFEDNPNIRQPMVVGSCNGLIGVKYDFVDYMLWNPVTQECLTYDGGAPVLLTDPTAVGLCYEASTDEYTVVLVGTIRYNFEFLSCIELINFSTNESKGVNYKSGDPAFDLNGVGTVVCGVPHWVKENDNVDDPWDRKRVFYFDTKNETFNELNLPSQIQKRKRVLGLGALDGQRQLGIVVQDVKKPYQSYDVWVMKEYGKFESWTYLCNIPSLNVRSDYEYLNLVGLKPSEIWVHHVLSRAETEKLKLLTYDVKNKSIKHIGGPSDNENTAAVNLIPYEPSFVSPFRYRFSRETTTC